MAEQLPQPKTLQPGGAANAPSREEMLATLSLEPVDLKLLNMRPSCAAEIRTSPRRLVHEPRVLLTLALDPTSNAVCATLTSARGRCPECTDVELPGWLVASGRDDMILPEESESEMMSRMCQDCLDCPSSFCGNECLKVSHDKFYQERWKAPCAHCNATMSWCTRIWAATCTRCERAFCATCVARGLTLIEDEDPGGPNLPKPSPRRQLRLVHKARLEFIYPDGSIVEIPEGEYNDYEHIQRTMYEQAKWQQACDWAKAPDDADIVAPHILEAEAQWAGEQAAMEEWEADNHKHDTVGRK